MTTLTSIPDRFSAGSTVKYVRSFAAYPTSDGWALTLYLAGKSSLSVAAVVANNQFEFTLTAAQTGSLQPGLYAWTERVSKAGEVYDAASGQLTVEVDLSNAGPGDAQTWAERTLALVEARIEDRLPKDMESYQIAGRSVVNIPASELFKLRAQLRAEVARERNPGGFGQRITFRFTEPGA